MSPVRLFSAPANRGAQARRRSVAPTGSCGMRPQLAQWWQLPAIAFLRGWRRHCCARSLGSDLVKVGSLVLANFLKRENLNETRKSKRNARTHTLGARILSDRRKAVEGAIQYDKTARKIRKTPRSENSARRRIHVENSSNNRKTGARQRG